MQCGSPFKTSILVRVLREITLLRTEADQAILPRGSQGPSWYAPPALNNATVSDNATSTFLLLRPVRRIEPKTARTTMSNSGKIGQPGIGASSKFHYFNFFYYSYC